MFYNDYTVKINLNENYLQAKSLYKLIMSHLGKHDFHWRSPISKGSLHCHITCKRKHMLILLTFDTILLLGNSLAMI